MLLSIASNVAQQQFASSTCKNSGENFYRWRFVLAVAGAFDSLSRRNYTATGTFYVAVQFLLYRSICSVLRA